MRLLPIFLLCLSCTSMPKKKTEAAPSGIIMEVSEEQKEMNTPYDMFLLAAPGILAVSWLGYRFIVEKEKSND